MPGGSHGFGSGSLGNEGAPRTEGQIRISGQIAKKWLTKKNRDYSLMKGLFGGNPTDKEKDVENQELVYYVDGMQYSGDVDDKQFVPIATTLGDLGAEARQLFPHDVEMQKEHLMSRIIVVGASAATVYFAGTGDGGAHSTVAINIFGLVSHGCPRAVSIGDYLRPTPRDPMAEGENSNYLPNNASEFKVTLMLTPVDMSGISFANCIKRNMRHFQANPENYKQAFDVYSNPHGSGRVWAMNTMRTFLNYNVLIGLFALNETIDPKDKMSKAVNDVFALFSERSGLLTGRLPTGSQLSFQNHLQSVACLNDMLEYNSERAFGYNRQTKRNKFLNQDGDVITTPGGRLLEMQLNMHTMFYSAMAQMYRETEVAFARAAKSMKEGGVGESILLGPK